MTYTMVGPIGVAHILAGLVASLAAEFPSIRWSRLLGCVEGAHDHARGFLPDLSDYASAVARIARADLAAQVKVEAWR
ncbi:MAG TPA: hypothetical protein VHV79_07650 [Mycobacteriales bacterium]|nr:hypothetical protein [Mycobacteriales bacterium]